MEPLPVLWPSGTLYFRVSAKRSGSPGRKEFLVSHTSSSSSSPQSLCQVRLLLPEGSQTLAILIDSGSDANIMDSNPSSAAGCRSDSPASSSLHQHSGWPTSGNCDPPDSSYTDVNFREPP